MLFLDFLWIFVFIVFLNAHPIFKSMTNKSMPHNIDLIKKNQDCNRLDNYEKHTTRYDMMKNIPFQENKNNVIFRRKIACKKTNDFDKYELPKNYENYGDAHIYKEVTSNTRTIFQSTKTDALRKRLNFIDLISTTPSLLDISILENSNNFFDLSSPRSLNEDIKFLGTAEIEAILNKVKHREIQMITGHEPYLANLITNTIIQTTYSKAYANSNKYTWPGGIKKTKNKLLNHLFQRSIKEECSTLAQNIENKLQQKIQNVYKRVKNKLSRDYNKEIENFQYAAKQKFEGITNKFCNSTTKFSQKHPSNATVANSRNTCSTKKFKPLQKNKSTYSTAPPNHTISTLRDEFSIPTIIEKLLSKVQEHSVINTFTTIRNSIKNVERAFRSNQNISSDDQDIFHVLEYPNANLDADNKIGFLETVTNDQEHNDKSNATTEDTSFEALSKKLSYNDYVNGYKYYLNYQKEQDDDKFSNLIRYQAHKHHNVDDIGKFILNKIPQLSTKLYKRHFVESATLEDQDVSTKSEDSWFKRHFFIHVDTDPPKQFHSTQTVICKNNILQDDNSNDLRNNTFSHKRYIKKRDNFNAIRKHRHSFILSNNKFNSPFNKYITSHTRSSATVMVQKGKDRKALRSFQKFYCKPNQKHERESENNLNIQINYDDAINERLKTDLSQEHFKVPITRSRIYKNVEGGMKLILPNTEKPNDMNLKIHLDNNLIHKESESLINIKGGSNLIKDNDLADKVTEMYLNNLITTDSIHKLYEKDMQLKNYYKKSRNTILRHDYNFVGSIKSTTNSVVNKVNKSNVKDTSRNTGGKLYSMGLLKSTKFAQNMDKSLQEYGNTLYKNNYANSNANSVTNKKNNSNITFSENIKVQPKQYFMTPMPMKMEDFNKFLKDHQIDVESVTAPLKHPHPFSPSIIDKWNLKERPKSIKRDIFA